MHLGHESGGTQHRPARLIDNEALTIRSQPFHTAVLMIGLVGMVMLDLDRVAFDASWLRCCGGGAESFRGVGATVSTVTLAPILLAKAILCWTALLASFEPAVGIRMFAYIALSLIAVFPRRRTPNLTWGELLADGQQFATALCARFWVSHFKSLERIEDNFGYNQPRIIRVVTWNDVPRRVAGACRA
jgi:hypothetical protein